MTKKWWNHIFFRAGGLCLGQDLHKLLEKAKRNKEEFSRAAAARAAPALRISCKTGFIMLWNKRGGPIGSKPQSKTLLSLLSETLQLLKNSQGSGRSVWPSTLLPTTFARQSVSLSERKPETTDFFMWEVEALKNQLSKTTHDLCFLRIYAVDEWICDSVLMYLTFCSCTMEN